MPPKDGGYVNQAISCRKDLQAEEKRRTYLILLCNRIQLEKFRMERTFCKALYYAIHYCFLKVIIIGR